MVLARMTNLAPSATGLTVYEAAVKLGSGEFKSVADYRGRVLLIVNVASKCAFTPQYAGLQDLYSQYHAKGLEVLAFPCDQFGHQEPGSDAEIRKFCETKFRVSFPIFAKIDVNGAFADPLYVYLKRQKVGLFGSAIKWNFTKFLISRSGAVICRYPPTTTPAAITPAIEAALAQPGV
jgi:glutathione peroxidase